MDRTFLEEIKKQLQDATDTEINLIKKWVTTENPHIARITKGFREIGCRDVSTRANRISGTYLTTLKNLFPRGKTWITRIFKPKLTRISIGDNTTLILLDDYKDVVKWFEEEAPKFDENLGRMNEIIKPQNLTVKCDGDNGKIKYYLYSSYVNLTEINTEFCPIYEHAQDVKLINLHKDLKYSENVAMPNANLAILINRNSILELKTKIIYIQHEATPSRPFTIIAPEHYVEEMTQIVKKGTK